MSDRQTKTWRACDTATQRLTALRTRTPFVEFCVTLRRAVANAPKRYVHHQLLAAEDAARHMVEDASDAQHRREMLWLSERIHDIRVEAARAPSKF